MYLQLAFLVSLVAARFQAEKVFYASEDAGRYFEDFIATYNKQYASEKEKYFRFNVFKGNLKKINELNSKSQATYGINEFGDLTHDESMQYFTETVIDSVSEKRCKVVEVVEGSVPAPDSLDWRKKGKVTRVKNQRKCFNSGIFSCIANLESQYAIKYNKLLEFSEQQVIDCCDIIDCETVVVKLLERGILMAGNAVSNTLFYYRGGIHECDECNGFGMNFLLVGYGKDGDKPYWILKNSWGEKWGEKGYIRLAMTELKKDNCYISGLVFNSLVV